MPGNKITVAGIVSQGKDAVRNYKASLNNAEFVDSDVIRLAKTALLNVKKEHVSKRAKSACACL